MVKTNVLELAPELQNSPIELLKTATIATLHVDESVLASSARKEKHIFPLIDQKEYAKTGYLDYGGVTTDRIAMLLGNTTRCDELVSQNSDFALPIINDTISMDFSGKEDSIYNDLDLRSRLLWSYRILGRLDFADLNRIDTGKNYSLLKESKILDDLDVVSTFSDTRSRTEFILSAISTADNTTLEYLLANYKSSEIISIFDSQNPTGWLRYDYIESADTSASKRAFPFPDKQELLLLESTFGRNATAYILQTPLLTRSVIYNSSRYDARVLPELKTKLDVIFDKYSELIPPVYLKSKSPFDTSVQFSSWESVLLLAKMVDKDNKIPTELIERFMQESKLRIEDFPIEITEDMKPNIKHEKLLRNLNAAQYRFNMGSVDQAIRQATLLSSPNRPVTREEAELYYLEWMLNNPDSMLQARYQKSENEYRIVDHDRIVGSIGNPRLDFLPRMGIEVENIQQWRLTQTEGSPTVTLSNFPSLELLQQIGFHIDEHDGVTPIDGDTGFELAIPPAFDVSNNIQLWQKLRDLGLVETLNVNPETLETTIKRGVTLHLTFGSRAEADKTWGNNRKIPTEFRHARHLLELAGYGILPDHAILRPLLADIRNMSDETLRQDIIQDFLRDPIKYFILGTDKLSQDEITRALTAYTNPRGEIEDINSRNSPVPRDTSRAQRDGSKPINDKGLPEQRNLYQMRMLRNRNPFTSELMMQSGWTIWSCMDHMASTRQSMNLDVDIFEAKFLKDLMPIPWKDLDVSVNILAESISEDQEYQNESLQKYSQVMLASAFKLRYLSEGIKQAYSLKMDSSWDINYDNSTTDNLNNEVTLNSDWMLANVLLQCHAGNNPMLRSSTPTSCKIHFEDGQILTMSNISIEEVSSIRKRDVQYRNVQIYHGLDDEGKKVRVEIIEDERNPTRSVSKVTDTEYTRQLSDSTRQSLSQLLDEPEFRKSSGMLDFRDRLRTAFLVGLSHPNDSDLILGFQRTQSDTFLPTIIGGKQFNSPTDAIHEMLLGITRDLSIASNQLEVEFRAELENCVMGTMETQQKFIRRWYTKSAKNNHIFPDEWFRHLKEKILYT